MGHKTGLWGDIAAFSFYPTKRLACLGDGEMIVTGDTGLAERATMLREFGWHDRYVSECSGLNSRLDELQAAILCEKLRYLEQENGDRRVVASIYDNRLKDAQLRYPCAILRPYMFTISMWCGIGNGMTFGRSSADVASGRLYTTRCPFICSRRIAAGCPPLETCTIVKGLRQEY